MSSNLLIATDTWLEERSDELVDATFRLCEQNSFTDSPRGGRAVAELLRELFAMPGLVATTRPSERFADHLVFASESSLQSTRTVGLVGHLDTVFPPGVFEVCARQGEFASGPGVVDMKGGLVVIAYALRAVAETVGLGSIPQVRVVVVADEEVGSPEGTHVIAEALAGASACLVFEAGRKGDLVITRRRGTGGMKAIAHGKAAHAGTNHADGKNALWALCHFVDRVQGLTDYTRGVTVNVGKVSGGQGKNTVPDRAEAVLDIRFETRADGEALVAAIHEAARAAERHVDGTRIELEGGIGRLPLERSDASAALAAEYGACARASGLGEGESGLVGGGSDANTASTLGIPAIDGLGPRGTGFHTKDERMEIASLVPKAQALARFLLGRGAQASVR